MSIIHKSTVSKYFEDFSIGDKYVLPSRTQTSAVFSMFQGASGDNDPIHYDKEFCKQRGHPEMLAHGMQVFIQTAAGAGSFPSEIRDSLLGLVEFSGKMLKPVYREDTGLTCISKAELWRNQRRIGDNVLIIDDDRFETAIDIHSKFDLKLANIVFDMILEERPDDLPPMPVKA